MTRLLLACSILGVAACDSSPDADVEVTTLAADTRCYSGGPILTHSGTVEAVRTEGARIAYVGSYDGDWCPDGAETIDLMGNTMMPGLVDAHAHLIGIGLREMTLNLEGTQSVPDLQARVKAAAAELKDGETLYGRGWIETHWPEGRFPTRQDIDAVVSDRPVLLERADGHAMVVNSRALEMSELTRETVAPDGGAINRDAAGEPNGMLVDNAMRLVQKLMPGLDADTKREAYRQGAELYASRGWTNIHNMSMDPQDVALLEQMDAAGELPIRVYNSLDTRNMSKVRDASPTDKVTTRAIKLYADGALGSRGAALLQPYSDDPENEGLVTLTDDMMVPTLRAAARAGVQVNTHAIGDRANRMVLDWYESAYDEADLEDARWRVEHTQIVDMDDIPRYAALGIIPSMQPSHAIGDLHFAVDRLGPDRLAGGYAWRTLIDSGARIAGGSDAPVEVGDPRIEFHAATQRNDLEGYSNADWRPDEKVTEAEALKMFTIWPAYAAFQEDALGDIAVGKLADFSVFDASLTSGDAMSAQPVMTIVNGETVWSAN